MNLRHRQKWNQKKMAADTMLKMRENLEELASWQCHEKKQKQLKRFLQEEGMWQRAE